jgi:hypothetical protein
MPSLEELASLPAGQDQIDRAKVYCAGDSALEGQLAEFIEAKPTRGQMVQFLEQLASRFQESKNKDKALAVCATLGIEKPTGSGMLLALRLSVLEEAAIQNQRHTNEILKKLGANLGNKTIKHSGFFSNVLGGAFWGTVAGAVIRKP